MVFKGFLELIKFAWLCLIRSSLLLLDYWDLFCIGFLKNSQEFILYLFLLLWLNNILFGWLLSCFSFVLVLSCFRLDRLCHLRLRRFFNEILEHNGFFSRFSLDWTLILLRPNEEIFLFLKQLLRDTFTWPAFNLRLILSLDINSISIHGCISFNVSLEFSIFLFLNKVS